MTAHKKRPEFAAEAAVNKAHVEQQLAEARSIRRDIQKLIKRVRLEQINKFGAPHSVVSPRLSELLEDRKIAAHNIEALKRQIESFETIIRTNKEAPDVTI